ncbi:uncharacterized protein At4g17910-like isoform X3 [Vigna radiata var. radiata]|uniref:Uncharacterized protein At4g17910-like isoform X3 n=1 Tax=Vigna radiata var. radiata TaxID=3916 RepID=A0A3Q0ESD1_VIGRR|nr:uncharacterized protein At4g17910-like isoform X3 [Vigna radiata var. radiata]XP_022634615.1 uncharacterized protein At4g17910-like isoform X3 [Vigna radiata var. radiata]
MTRGSSCDIRARFVSNLTGSSMPEIVALTVTVPVLVFIRHSISSISITGASLKKKNDDALSCKRNFKSYFGTLSLDFLVIVVPMLLCFTVLANWTYIITCSLTILTLLYIATKRSGGSSSFEGEPNSLRAYVTSYRVLVMIITILCILAVDFKIFPRRYAKTETYGTSLMDLGVGAFVLANSLVSRQARNIASVSWKTAVVSSSPLIILGFLRLVTTTGVDYQVHVGEYGVHWNFFFTLAAVSILSSFINISPQYCGVIGSLLLVGYQLCLVQGLNHYLLSDERGVDILSQNKEGIFSIFGYWGMYLLGVYLGNSLIFGSHSSGFRSSRWVRMRIWALSILFWLLTVLLDRHVERVSRRTCNLPYVTMVLADNLQLLSVLMLADLVPGRKTSVLEEAFSRNLLATFLLANILTGLVNLSMDTLSVSSIKALIILLVYAYILSIVIGIVDYFGIKLKFW